MFGSVTLMVTVGREQARASCDRGSPSRERDATHRQHSTALSDGGQGSWGGRTPEVQVRERSRMRAEQGDPCSFPKGGDNSSGLGVTGQCDCTAPSLIWKLGMPPSGSVVRIKMNETRVTVRAFGYEVPTTRGST